MPQEDQRALENISAKKRKQVKEQALKADVARIGDRLDVKFIDGVWYGGEIKKIERDESGTVVLFRILYDDGVEVDCEWPDPDIVLVGNDTEIYGPQLKRKVFTGKQDIQGEWMFTCSFDGCDLVFVESFRRSRFSKFEKKSNFANRIFGIFN